MIAFVLFVASLFAQAPARHDMKLAVGKAADVVRVLMEKPKLHPDFVVSNKPVDSSAQQIPVGPVATIPERINRGQDQGQATPLTLAAASAIALDRDSNAVLFEKNKDTHAAIGSTTKMMTAIVVLESGVRLDEVVTVSDAAAHTGGSTMGAQSGDQFTVKDLLYGLLIPSGNDAATALAEYTTSGHVDQFVALMNKKARELGLHHTHFANPTGLDQDGNYSSVYDLAQLMDYALNNPFFLKAFSVQEYQAYVLNKPETRSFKATDKLIGTRPDIIGGKTGFTYQAGYCFIGVSQRNNHQLITVVLNAKDRFGETEQIIDWVFDHYKWSN